MRITGGLEAENDRLVQIWATKQRSYYSHKPAECGHHYYSRHNKLLRWDLHNIIPLTFEEHRMLHDGNLQIDIQNPFRVQYLRNMCNKDYKTYLLEKGLTEQEYIKECNRKLKEKINEKL
jgi:hypothetical protein